MSILNQFLKKKGVRYEDLNDEEKATFNSWREALAGRRLTDEDVDKFLSRELESVNKKLVNPENSDHLDIFLKMKLEMILNIKQFLASPETERRLLEQQINTQL